MDPYDSDEDFEEAQPLPVAAVADRAQFDVIMYPLNVDGELHLVDVQNGSVAAINSRNRLTVTGLAADDYTRHISQQPHGLFVDPRGSHVFVSTTNGELEYINVKYRCHSNVALSSSGAASLLGNIPLVGGVAPSQLPSATFVVNAVGWDKANTSDASTGFVLIASSRDSMIYEVRVDAGETGKNSAIQSGVTPLLSFSSDIGQIASVEVERFQRHNKTVVLVSTQTRLFAFKGPYVAPGASFKPVFESYRTNQSTAMLADVPSAGDNPNNGKINIYRSTLSAPPQSYAWCSSVGIRHGLFNVTADDDVPLTKQLIDFGPRRPGGFEKVPSDVALTAYHQILTYDDRVQVLFAPAGLPWAPLPKSATDSSGGFAARAAKPSGRGAPGFGAGRSDGDAMRLSEHDFSDRLRCNAPVFRRGGRAGVAKCTVRDIAKRKLYVFTTACLYEIEVRNEHQSAWRLFLERALDEKEPAPMRDRYFAAAYNITRTFAKKKSSVVTWYRAKFFVEKCSKFSQATDMFAECDRFEDALLYLSSIGRPNVVIDFLEKRLAVLQQRATARNPMQMHLACVTALTLQMHLERLADADANGNEIVRAECERKLNAFVLQRTRDMRTLLDDIGFYHVVERLINAHGRVDTMLKFAEAMEKYRYTVGHYVNREQYSKACDILTRHCKTSSAAPLWYEFGPPLVQHCPSAFFAGLMGGLSRVPGGGKQNFLRPELLIPAFLTYNMENNEDPSESDLHLTMQYVEYLIKGKCAGAPVLWNYMLSLALEHDVTSLPGLLSHPDALYAKEFALRKCLDSRDPAVLPQCVFLYCQLGLIEEAVRVALNAGDVAKAKSLLRDAELERPTLNKLWREVAEVVLNQEKSTNAVLAVVAESNDILKLEDVLPILTRGDTVLREIKDAICNSLDEYEATIKALKNKMTEATETAKQIKDEEQALTNQFGFVTASQRCELCSKALLQNAAAAPFVMYPVCGHAFHEHCVVKLLCQCAPERIEAMATELGLEPEERTVDALKDADCPACGEYAITDIGEPYFDDDDAQADVWLVL